MWALNFCEMAGTTCEVRGLGQVAKLLAARVGVRMPRAFGAGKARESSGPAGLALRKKQGRVRHEDGEGKMDRKDKHSANTLMRKLEPMCVRAVCVTRRENVRATAECVQTLRPTHGSRYYFCKNLDFKKKYGFVQVHRGIYSFLIRSVDSGPLLGSC